MLTPKLTSRICLQSPVSNREQMYLSEKRLELACSLLMESKNCCQSGKGGRFGWISMDNGFFFPSPQFPHPGPDILQITSSVCMLRLATKYGIATFGLKGACMAQIFKTLARHGTATHLLCLTGFLGQLGDLHPLPFLLLFYL